MAGNGLVPKKVIATKSDGSTYETTVHTRPDDAAAVQFNGVPTAPTKSNGVVGGSGLDTSRYESIQSVTVEEESQRVIVETTQGRVALRVAAETEDGEVIANYGVYFTPNSEFARSGFVDQDQYIESIIEELDGIAKDAAEEYGWVEEGDEVPEYDGPDEGSGAASSKSSTVKETSREK